MHNVLGRDAANFGPSAAGAVPRRESKPELVVCRNVTIQGEHSRASIATGNARSTPPPTTTESVASAPYEHSFTRIFTAVQNLIPTFCKSTNTQTIRARFGT